LLPQGHLRRLDSVWIDSPIYLITSCTEDRSPVLANRENHAVLREEFETAPKRYGWTVGRYVVMPDHLHFFCGQGGAVEPTNLPRFVGGFKQWTAKRILRATGLNAPFWQREYFDHLLRSAESYERKWRYVMENPVRARLVEKSTDWPYAGEIDALPP
jgi:putative transposase